MRTVAQKGLSRSQGQLENQERKGLYPTLPGGPRLPCTGTLYKQVGKGGFRWPQYKEI